MYATSFTIALESYMYVSLYDVGQRFIVVVAAYEGKRFCLPLV